MKLKVASSIISILVVVLTGVVLLIAGGPHHTYAFVTSGAECGLEVTVAPEYVNVTNLNPGDNKGSYLMVHNTNGTNQLTYFFKITEMPGGKLGEKLVLTVEYQGKELYSGPLSGFEEKYMGALAAGVKEKINIKIHLPGAETGNEYQGASVKVKFAFRANCDRGGGGGGYGEGDNEPPITIIDDPDPSKPPGEEPEAFLPDESISVPTVQPGAPPPDETILVTTDESVATPRTGELPPAIFYATGALLMLVGVMLGRRYRNNKR